MVGGENFSQRPNELREKFTLFISYTACCHLRSCPCRLEIKSSGQCINIQHFTYQEQVRYQFTFKTCKIDFIKIHTTGSDEFFFKSAFADNAINISSQSLDQFIR